jgi:hypothetical protein
MLAEKVKSVNRFRFSGQTGARVRKSTKSIEPVGRFLFFLFYFNIFIYG